MRGKLIYSFSFLLLATLFKFYLTFFRKQQEQGAQLVKIPFTLLTKVTNPAFVRGSYGDDLITSLWILTHLLTGVGRLIWLQCVPKG